jgi:hypothetical protein
MSQVEVTDFILRFNDIDLSRNPLVQYSVERIGCI